MNALALKDLEREARSRWDKGDLHGAATVVLRVLGPEIFGLLVALHREEDEAADVFSTFSEDLWRGLPGFAWQCPLRTWAYTLARHASRRSVRGARHRRKHLLASDSSVAERLAQEIRTTTKPYLRTDSRERFAAIRAGLPHEDQLLLILRVDRGLEWSDLVRVLSDSAELSDADIARESARLRKRFQSLKKRLIGLAKEQGLVAADRA